MTTCVHVAAAATNRELIQLFAAHPAGVCALAYSVGALPLSRRGIAVIECTILGMEQAIARITSKQHRHLTVHDWHAAFREFHIALYISFDSPHEHEQRLIAKIREVRGVAQQLATYDPVAHLPLTIIYTDNVSSAVVSSMCTLLPYVTPNRRLLSVIDRIMRVRCGWDFIGAHASCTLTEMLALFCRAQRQPGACVECTRLTKRRCTHCRVTYLCSTACRRAHWSAHRDVCPALAVTGYALASASVHAYYTSPSAERLSPATVDCLYSVLGHANVAPPLVYLRHATR